MATGGDFLCITILLFFQISFGANSEIVNANLCRVEPRFQGIVK